MGDQPPLRLLPTNTIPRTTRNLFFSILNHSCLGGRLVQFLKALHSATPCFRFGLRRVGLPTYHVYNLPRRRNGRPTILVLHLVQLVVDGRSCH